MTDRIDSTRMSGSRGGALGTPSPSHTEELLTYYQSSRTHLALAKDAPEPRAIQYHGEVVAIPQVGGLHSRYERRVA